VSDGGLLVAVAEMAMGGGVGATLWAPPAGIAPHHWWFGEDQGRYVLAVIDATATVAAAEAAGIPARHLGQAGSPGTTACLTLGGDEPISVVTLREAHQRFFPEWMRS
jgi:phosphoribosylformylglycinamidine synthase